MTDGSFRHPQVVPSEKGHFGAGYGDQPLRDPWECHARRSLRHTAVAWLIAEGVHVETTSRRMGHSSVAFTLSAYGHLMPGLDEQAADALDQSSRSAAVGLAWAKAVNDPGA